MDRYLGVVGEAALSRCCLLVLLVLADFLLPDHFPGDDVATFGRNNVAMMAFTKWDAAYYLQLAKTGSYPTHQMMAFYPTYPYLIRQITTWFSTYFNSSDNLYVIAAVVISNVSFIWSVVMLKQILQELLLTTSTLTTSSMMSKDTRLVRYAVWCYIWNPANVFFTTAYTESLYACCSFTGMWMLLLAHKQPQPTSWQSIKHVMGASCCFLWASSIRSNGLFNGIIVAFFILPTGCSILLHRQWFSLVTLVIPYMMLLLSVVLPFVLFNEHMHTVACHDCSAKDGGTVISTCLASSISATPVVSSTIMQYLQDWLLPSTSMYMNSRLNNNNPLPSPFKTPLITSCCVQGPYLCSMYSAVQREFWDVGLFRYFQLKQLPNFMLATPIVLLALYTVQIIIMHHRLWTRKENLSNDRSSAASRSTTRTRASLNNEWKMSFAMLAHVLHLVMITLLGVCLAHVQISTRLLCSSCPIIYLGMAYVLDDVSSINKKDDDCFIAHDDKSNSNHAVLMNRESCTRRITRQRVLIGYLVAYNTLGIILHPNFFPWT